MRTFKSGILLPISFFVCLSLSSCLNDDDIKEDKVEEISLTVASKTTSVISMEETETEYLIIKEGNKWSYLPNGWIEGFTYELGFEYNLKVRKVTPANSKYIQDAPRSNYYLLEIVSKLQKKTEVPYIE
ncbi:DUF4377 domain-containing protein [Barnesiella propionica]|uniref:DUF4377 domain-containing protein n=1 Tax=Barnesiella propionica TaxID=2981781 RepID=UPI0011C8C834|nr:DUF4377 domain-containing protein [Barnesiella propionica]MCU6770027.1 DUF4377 domain-containing protein [Barnesiella propionica]